ncbi:MAG: preprotein translocase subunit SecE [Candidatus Moraniibacteriota bacterium]|nr:MAG: preprotein translocase subunit SecE [Candidatus Moranbacteria bacterium]
MLKDFIAYLKESKAELKKVTWPTIKMVKRFTILVVLISVVMALFLGFLDAFFSWGLKTFVF